MRILIIFIFILGFINAYSQDYNDDRIDSLMQSVPLSDSDWLICISIELAGMRYDDNENPFVVDPNGSFLFKKKNGKCCLQKINSKSDFVESKIAINIFDSVISSYTTDSILKADGNFYHYIYKIDSPEVYASQDQSDHEPFYKLRMRTNRSIKQWWFPQQHAYISPEKLEFYKSVGIKENLNEKYNKSLFIYRVFINLCRLLIDYYRLPILH